MGRRQYTPSLHATTLESNKSQPGFLFRCSLKPNILYICALYKKKIDEDKDNQAGAPPARASVDAGRSSPVALLPSLPLRRGRTAVRAAARQPGRAGAAVPLAAAAGPALKRRNAGSAALASMVCPRRSGWP
jgi:hypothetical protein